jgi:hypothetical protein
VTCRFVSARSTATFRAEGAGAGVKARVILYPLVLYASERRQIVAGCS